MLIIHLTKECEMEQTTASIPQNPLPPSLTPSNPSTPWHFSPVVFKQISQQPAKGSSFKKVVIQPNSAEFAFVQRYFQHYQPADRAIARVYAVHNWAQTNAFEASISAMEQEASNPVFAPQMAVQIKFPQIATSTGT